MTDQNSVIRIYTDGACSGNPGPGAYAAILTYKGKELTLTRHFRLTTNNRMELLAVIDALKAIKSEDYPIEIYSDSTYVINAINQNWLAGWKKKGWKKVKNKDLWLEFDALYQRLRPTFHWVKGHNNHPYNERCDQLAVESISKPNPESDVDYEESLNLN
ncbi:MAG: ribonuclease HI [Thermaurantimonas sp.]